MRDLGHFEVTTSGSGLPSRGARLVTIGPVTPEERERYSRQILFAGLGEEGQEGLLRSHAAIVGCGALGSFQAAALARAGVGELTIVDRRIRRGRRAAQSCGGRAPLGAYQFGGARARHCGRSDA
ncbi:MAG: ThiF family adenylyltransferase [Bryobacteraceae bacterium]